MKFNCIFYGNYMFYTHTDGERGIIGMLVKWIEGLAFTSNGDILILSMLYKPLQLNGLALKPIGV